MITYTVKFKSGHDSLSLKIECSVLNVEYSNKRSDKHYAVWGGLSERAAKTSNYRGSLIANPKHPY